MLGGAAAVLFYEALQAATHLTMEVLARHSVPEPRGEAVGSDLAPGSTRRGVLVLLPVLGGLVSGVLVRRFAPEAEGTGTDGYIDAFHNKSGVMRGRVPVIKSLATIATLSTGGSVGKEGPTAQIGAGIGAAFGRVIRMGARARRTLMIAGAAAGLGAIFRAPLGGALTAIEVLYKEDLETDALTPAVLASVTAYTVFSTVNGFEHVFAFESEGFHAPAQLFVYALLGLLCSGLGIVYVKFLSGSKAHFFDRLPISRYLVPPLGGLLVGATGYFFPQVMGHGLGYVQQLVLGEPMTGIAATTGVLAGLALLKIFTSSCTLSSGGSGGAFAPSLFIGAMLGGSLGQAAQGWFPTLVPDIGPFVVVGMGAFFAGVANAPIASIVMVSELTGAYDLLPPLMLVATIALVTTRRWSIYSGQVDNRFSSPAHLWEMSPGALRQMTVRELADGAYDERAIVPADATLRDLERHSAETGETDLVLRDATGAYAGLVSMSDLAVVDGLEHLDGLVLARDLVNHRGMTLTPEDDLIRALELFAGREFDNIPIVDAREGRERLLGHIAYGDIVAFYKREHTRRGSAAE
ncbi:MAG: chloride channel protein [Gemmatimonadota bacterium]|nr:chloride channel protein [Gemmatimonadota bacterium]